MTYRNRMSVLLLTVASLALPACASNSYDSIRSLLPQLEGDELVEAYYKLYNISYYAGDQQRERASIGALLGEAERQGNMERQATARTALVYYYYNWDMPDSLIQELPRQKQFFAEHGMWNYYYDSWLQLANWYIFNGQNNTALRELKLMYEDAQHHYSDYGIAVASLGMGNAYSNLSCTDEAIVSYERCIRLLQNIATKSPKLLDVYPYYCGVLADKKDYGRMMQVTDQWYDYLQDKKDKLGLGVGDAEHSDYFTYYYNARAIAYIGTERFAEAETLLQKAYENTKDVSDVSQLNVLFNMAQLYLKWGNSQRALAYSDRVMGFYDQPDDPVGLLLAKKQRAEIFLQLRQPDKAASLYKEVYLLADSLNTTDVKNQLNEFNTLFKVDELERAQEQAKTRNTYVVLAIIIASLLIIGTVGIVMMRRLRRKNEELVIARDQAQESLRMKSNFIRNISHEIRTPLNILSGFTQLVTNPDIELSKDEKVNMNNQIVENTDRIAKLINTLLELSESSARTVIERSDTVSVGQLAALAADASGAAEDSHIDFVFTDETPADLLLHTSETYAVRALSLLLGNAVKFTGEGSVRLTARQEGACVAFVVEDTGVGIKPEDAERIFDEFVQLDEYKEGVGIGLPLSRNIARRLGGDVVFDASYVGGARFVLTLPI